MPPSTLQARIRAFEALGTGASKDVLATVAIHSESADSVPEQHLLDRPHSPTAASIPPIAPTTYSPTASPSLRHKSSLIDLKDWVIDDGAFRPSYSPTTTTIISGYSPLQTIKPLPHETAPLISFEGPPTPASLSKVPPLPPRKLSFNAPRSVSAPAASPTLPAPPPFTASTNNMLIPPKSDHHPYPPTQRDLSPSDGTRRAQGHVPASSVSSFHSVSLSSDGDDDDYSIRPAGLGALYALPMEREWTGTGTEDGESLDESFENVSAPSSFLPPIALPPRPQKPPGKPALVVGTKQQQPQPQPSQHPPQPPKLPQRPTPQARGSISSFTSQNSSPSSGSPISGRTPSASTSSLSLASTRRGAPPPPIPPTITAPHPPPHPRPASARTSVQSNATTASDRSSILSHGTTTSRTSSSSRASASAAPSSSSLTGTKQQALAMRARYDVLFVANVRAHAPSKSQKVPPPVPKRQNAGWRGLSIDIDMVAGTYAAPAQTKSISTAAPEPAPDARLDGRIVRKIWLKSGLDAQRLRDIWNECDPDGTGSLDRDAFARGMTRIDEELRRAQVLGRANGAGGSWGAASAASTLRPVPSRPILR